MTCPVALNKHPLSHVIFRKGNSFATHQCLGSKCSFAWSYEMLRKNLQKFLQHGLRRWARITFWHALYAPWSLTSWFVNITAFFWKNLFEARYSTALHWSLTQFTPAAMEVTATNFIERLFSVFVVLAGAVCIASHRRFVSEDFELIAPFDDCTISTHCRHRSNFRILQMVAFPSWNQIVRFLVKQA